MYISFVDRFKVRRFIVQRLILKESLKNHGTEKIS